MFDFETKAQGGLSVAPTLRTQSGGSLTGAVPANVIQVSEASSEATETPRSKGQKAGLIWISVPKRTTKVRPTDHRLYELQARVCQKSYHRRWPVAAKRLQRRQSLLTLDAEPLPIHCEAEFAK